MTIIREGSKYVRVAHTGQSTGSLYLSDLDDESNKKQSRQMPVYVPEGEHVDLPMDDEVKHSYQKGTIAGFVDAGLATATVIEQEAGAAEVWVSPDGDDSNPGTRSAPFETITAAVDHVQEMFDDAVVKKVRVLPGRYEGEAILINHQNVHLIGEKTHIFGQRIQVSTDGRDAPILAITNMTKEGWADYLAAGGPSWTEDGTDLTYTGADVAGYPIRLDDSVAMYCRIERMAFIQDFGDSVAKPPMMAVGAPGESGTTAIITKIHLTDIQSYQIVDSTLPSIAMKNCGEVAFENMITLYTVLLDNVQKSAWRSTSGGFTHSGGNTLSIRLAGENTATEGAPSSYGQFFSQYDAVSVPFDDVRLYSYTANRKINVSLEHAEVLYADNLHLLGPITAQAKRIACNSFTKTGDEAMDIARLDVAGDATISAGTSNAIKSGVIEGNLLVDGSANIDLTGVIVKGAVDLTNAGTVTWKGGHFEGTLTDPGNKLGTVAAGDYLYVT